MTLDVEEFLTTHTTRASLKSALTALDIYYQDIANQSVIIGKKYSQLLRDMQELRNEKEASEKNVVSLTEEVRCLNQQNKKLMKIMKDYSYPDIANDLLAKEGVLPGLETCLDPVKLERQIIRGETETLSKPSIYSGSSVIQGIFDRLEDDE